jgi:hypothetical protein
VFWLRYKLPEQLTAIQQRVSDATVTVNGGAFETVASGGTLDVEVEYETSLDNPVESIVANKIIIVDPIVLPTNRIYLRPEPTGEIYVPASAFYLDGCDSLDDTQ